MKKKRSFTFLRNTIMLCIILSMTLTSTLVYGATKKDVTKTFKDSEKVTNLIDNLTTYLGYQMLYTDLAYDNEELTIDDKFMLETAGMNMSNPTAKKLRKKTQNIFGEKPSIKNLTLYKDIEEFSAAQAFAGRLKDGTIVTMVGDWGMAAPSTKISKITKLSKTTYQVNTELYLVDNETNESTLIGNIQYGLKKNKTSKYDYIITSITVNRVEKKN